MAPASFGVLVLTSQGVQVRRSGAPGNIRWLESVVRLFAHMCRGQGDNRSAMPLTKTGPACHCGYLGGAVLVSCHDWAWTLPNAELRAVAE